MLSFEEYRQLREQGEKVPRGLGGEILPTGGAILGGIGGFALGGPVGAAAGAGIGGAVGEGAQQIKEKVSGVRTQFDPGQIAATGVSSAVLEGGFRAGAAVIKKGAQVAREPIVKVAAKLSGYGEDLIENILKRTPTTRAVLEGGEKVLDKITVATIQGVQREAKALFSASKNEVEKLHRLARGRVSKVIILSSAGNIVSKLNKVYNIGLNNAGKLLFNRPTLPSNIVSGVEQSAIQDAFHSTIRSLQSPSIKNIDAGLERLISLRSKTPKGTPTAGETKKIIDEMIDEVKQFLRNSGSKAHNAYADFLEKNLPKRVLIEDAKSIFGTTAKPTAEAVSKINTKLLQMFNTGKTALREGVEKGRAGIQQMGEKAGQDIKGGVSGLLLRSGGASVRGIPVSKISAVASVLRGVPRGILKNYVSTGKVTGELLTHPAIVKTAKTIGVSAKTLLQEITNLVENKKVD